LRIGDFKNRKRRDRGKINTLTVTLTLAMPKVKIDGHEIEVPKGTKVIEAAERLGIFIPRFCFHPALGAVGACRVCAVKFQEGPVKGVQMSCMIAAQDGMVVSTTDEEAVDFRKHVIEWLMMNHPHDCPVCDEGGHCLLQDLTVAGGHGIRRYQGKKRTYRDQYLGPFVQHEMNRCIHCYRCRRFYQEFSGYRDLGAMQIAYRTYFGRFSDGLLESPFSGNLIDICPTGVYTDKPSRFNGRRWDFERHPSLCLHCSLGCSTVTSARYRQIVRQESRFHENVNGFFICDRGRYGFSYENIPERPRHPRIGPKETAWEEARKTAVETLVRISGSNGPTSIACLGSGRSSLENLGMIKHVCRRQSWREPSYFESASQARGIRKAVARLEDSTAVSLREIEGADFVLAVGADPLNEAPMLALAMRQAFRQGGAGSSAVLDPRPVSLPMEFSRVPVAPADFDALLGALIKRTVNRSSAEGLSPEALKFYDALPSEYPSGGPPQDLLPGVEEGIKKSRRPAVICGTDMALESTIGLAADFARLLKAEKDGAGLFFLMPAANTFGAALLSPSGDSLEEIITAVENGRIKALVVVENDPFGYFPDQERLKRALAKLEFLLVLDYLPSRVAGQAHVFFPTSPLFETRCSFVNQEGRVQFAEAVHAGGIPILQTGKGDHPPRQYGVGIPGGEPRPAWRILAELSDFISSSGKESGPEAPQTVEDLWRWMAQEDPPFSRVQSPFGEAEVRDGVRLIPEGSKEGAFENSSPPGEERAENSLTLFLTDWTFGTEELAGYSPLVQQAEKKPSLLMQARDASRLGLQDKDKVRITQDGGSFEVELSVVQNMAPGVIILPRHRRLNWQVFKELPARIPVEGIKKI
jgi:NADH-quinone oxidoreductase subunit G